MLWTDISSIVIILLLVGWIFSLMRENSYLKKEQIRLMKKTGEYEEIKNEAKATLKITSEVKTVKSIREKYGLSLIDAKKIVDAVKE